jgi:hypothetical protein
MAGIESTPTVMAGIFAGVTSLQVKLVVFARTFMNWSALSAFYKRLGACPNATFFGGSGSSLKIVSDIRGVVFRSSQVKRNNLVFNILRMPTPLVIVYSERR